jgi:hypothetical protein
VDVEKLIDAMSAGMPREYRFAAALRECRGERGVLEHRAQVTLHLRPVARDQEILARREQPFVVVPRRGHERNAACERLEYADRRDAGQRLGVRTAGHVDRDAVA